MVPVAAGVLAVLVGTAVPVKAADHLAEARGYYNQELFELAMKSASAARADETVADEASLIIARANLERYRQTHDSQNLTAARDALRVVDATKLSPRNQAELTLGLGEWLFLNERYGPAAELFDTALGRDEAFPAEARDRILDWWATSVDRHAQVTPLHRTELYERIVNRMDAELRAHPGRPRPPTGCRRRPDRWATSIAPGRLRSPDGCAPASRPSTAPRFGPISIGSCRPRSSRSARERWRARNTTRATPWTR